MRGAFVVAVLVLTLVAAPAPASDGATQTRSVRALAALPTPLGPVTALDDGHVWEVTVPTGVTVFVDATAAPGSLFHLDAHEPEKKPAWKPRAPTFRDGHTLPAGIWRVVLDPAAGAAVNVDLVFRGFVGDMAGGAPAAFGLRDIKGPNPCVVRGACLP